MSIVLIEDDVLQAKAILRDAIYKINTSTTNKDSLGILKLIKAREENIDFEIQLAEKLCGDNDNYPYRSSYYITKLFEDCGFSDKHDGSTRRTWIKDVLLKMDTSQIALLIKNGLFRKADYKNQKLRTERNKDISDDEFLENAKRDFRKFIDESLTANEVVELEEIVNLNVNIDLLFQTNPKTKDEELNGLIEEAKERYLKRNDQNIALEKIWDAFERVKTYHDADKKKSSEQLIQKMAIELAEQEIRNEFESLTKIGNTYRIRHHETDKKELSNPLQVKYLFFRMLALIDLSIEVLKLGEKEET